MIQMVPIEHTLAAERAAHVATVAWMHLVLLVLALAVFAILLAVAFRRCRAAEAAAPEGSPELFRWAAVGAFSAAAVIACTLVLLFEGPHLIADVIHPMGVPDVAQAARDAAKAPR